MKTELNLGTHAIRTGAGSGKSANPLCAGEPDHPARPKPGLGRLVIGLAACLLLVPGAIRSEEVSPPYMLMLDEHVEPAEPVAGFAKYFTTADEARAAVAELDLKWPEIEMPGGGHFVLCAIPSGNFAFRSISLCTEDIVLYVNMARRKNEETKPLRVILVATPPFSVEISEVVVRIPLEFAPPP